MNPEYPPGHFFKDRTVVPRVLLEKAQRRAEDREWERTKTTVDARDHRICQVTGKHLLPGHVDGWLALERHHLEPRSRSKGRRWTAHNVWTTSRAVHQLIHARALYVFDKAGKPAKDVRAIDHVAWNRKLVAKGDEPCLIRKGLAVRELPA